MEIILNMIELTNKEKAYIGDGLVQAAIGMVYFSMGFEGKDLGWMNSNAAFNHCWYFHEHGTFGDGIKFKGKEYANLFEKEVYNIFINSGIDGVKKFVIKYHLPYVKYKDYKGQPFFKRRKPTLNETARESPAA